VSEFLTCEHESDRITRYDHHICKHCYAYGPDGTSGYGGMWFRDRGDFDMYRKTGRVGSARVGADPYFEERNQRLVAILLTEIRDLLKKEKTDA